MMVSVDVRNDLLSERQEYPWFGSNISTDLKCSDVKESHLRIKHVGGWGIDDISYRGTTLVWVVISCRNGPPVFGDVEICDLHTDSKAIRVYQPT